MGIIANESHFDDNIKNPYCPIYTTSIKYSSVSFASISSKLSRNALGSSKTPLLIVRTHLVQN